LTSLSESEILDYVKDLDNDVKQIKDEVYRLTWHMRGGVSSEDLFWRYSAEDREIISKIIADNIETTNKTGLPLL
jgi:ADP-dependent phosphofructokinase/glucokinase